VSSGGLPLYSGRMQLKRFRVEPGARKPLSAVPADFTGGFDDKADGQRHLQQRLERLKPLQEKLYAQRQHALLVLLQGMDTSGKDSAITHVFSGFNPQGLSVHNFKQPSSEELAHDFLWSAARVLPARGQIAVFNRSYYEEVLIVRVHSDVLAKQGLPADRIRSTIWTERFEDINAFETHLWRSGTTVVKCFLHISRGEQEKRLLARIDDPTKNWKFSPGDLPERTRWTSYMAAYADALSSTSTPHAPWYVIPADHKWFAHAAIAEILYDTLRRLDLRFPALTPAQRRELSAARGQLTRKGRTGS
jgi:PPK2 family polyphosphate:nucleotide phosphotransferase